MVRMLGVGIVVKSMTQYRRHNTGDVQRKVSRVRTSLHEAYVLVTAARCGCVAIPGKIQQTFSAEVADDVIQSRAQPYFIDQP
jgi:hypothetical protein